MIKAESRQRFFRNSVVRNALSLYGMQAANYILPWFTFPYTIRVLGAEKFGLIAFATSLITYFQAVTEYGFNLTATREISIHRDDPVKLSQIFSATLLAKTILMTGSFIVLTAVVYAVPRFRAEAPLFFISFLVVVANVVFPVWLFQGIEKMENITYREVGARLLGLAPTFLLVRRQSDYVVAAGIYSGSMLLAGAVSYLGFSRVTTARLVWVSWREVKRTFKEGWNIFLSTAAITIYTRSNTFILGLLASPAEVGYFSAAQRLIEAARSLVYPITAATFPHISRLSHESPEKGLDFLRRNRLRMTLPFVILSAGLLLGAPAIGLILFGRNFGPSIPLLRMMSPIPFILATGSVYSTFYMLGMGFKKQWSRLIISAGFFNFVALFLLLLFMKPSAAIAVTSVLVELWVTAGAYLFYRMKQRVK